MHTIVNKILGYEVQLSVPSNTDEYNGMDKSRPNACLDDAIKYTILHGWNNDGRDAIVEVIERLTGVKRKMRPGTLKTDGTPGAEVPDETHKVYLARALAESKVNIEDTVPEVLAALSKIPFDPSPSERSSGAGRIPKEFYAIADGILEKGPEAASKAVRKLSKLNSGLEIKVLEDGTPDRDSLALAVRINAQRVNQELLAA